jgi:microcystin degradation protein MlrC
MRKRVLLAGLAHETHTFVSRVTPLEAFTCHYGNEIRDIEGDGSPMDGVLEVARAKNWDLLPVIDLWASPSGTVKDEVVELFWSTFKRVAQQEAPGGIDGIYLVLHGAMVSESFTDVEGEMFRRIRSLDGLADIPLCGVTDLHGNFTAIMARYSNGLITYQKNPHTDARQSAVKAAYLLDRLMESGERPTTVWVHPPVMWSPSGTDTAKDPMRILEERARAIEKAHPEILSVSVYGGFSFADTPETGVSFSAVTLGKIDDTQATLSQLSDLAVSLQAAGNPPGIPLQQVMEQQIWQQKGPIILVEPADNIGGGAPGDITCVLQALVEHKVPNSAVVINDPISARHLWTMQPGERTILEIGGKSGEIGAQPLPLEVELVSKSDGRFKLEDRQSHLASMGGENIDMGPSAVVRHEGVTILLTSHATPPFDLGQWRSQGIEPGRLLVIGVKAAVGHRRAYDPIAVASYTLDSPGPCAENLQRLPFRRVRRPIYPLDVG